MAVHVRVIVSVLPQPGTLASLYVIATAPQLSVPVAEPVAAGLVSPVHSTVAAAGQVMVGAVVSTTEMVWSPDAELAQASVAVHVRVIVDACGHVVLGVTESTLLAASAGSQSSVVVAVPVLDESVEASHSTVVLAGTVSDGMALSPTDTVVLQVS